MEYTYDWNNEFKKNTSGINNLSLCLEIGCFEGLTSNYIIDNMLNENGFRTSQNKLFTPTQVSRLIKNNAQELIL